MAITERTVGARRFIVARTQTRLHRSAQMDRQIYLQVACFFAALVLIVAVNLIIHLEVPTPPGALAAVAGSTLSGGRT